MLLVALAQISWVSVPPPSHPCVLITLCRARGLLITLATASSSPLYPITPSPQVLAGSMFKGMKMAGVLRISEDVETLGMDLSKHGGSAYEYGGPEGPTLALALYNS